MMMLERTGMHLGMKEYKVVIVMEKDILKAKE